MILQKLALSLRRRDWGAVLIEIGIVVVGIFFGLQVDDWNRAREDRELELQYAVRLIEDVDRLRAANSRSADVASERIADLKRALAAIRGRNLDEESMPTLRTQLGSLDFYPGLDADSAVLAEFVGTGNIRVIGDPGLRARVNELVALLEETKRDNKAHFDAFLRLRADTHRALRLTPTQTWAERIDSTAEELLGNSLLDYVLSFSIELYSVQQREWQRTDETVLEIRDEIAAAYGLPTIVR